MLITIIVIVVVLVALVAFGVAGFNKLRTTDIGAQEALGGIDVQLTRRADLIPNLVETVKGYAAHEKGVFEEVTAARAGVAGRRQGRRRPGQGGRRRPAAGGAGQPQRGRGELPRPQGEPELPRPAEPAGRDREPDLVRPPVLQRRGRPAEQAHPDDPVDVLHRCRERAPPRLLRGAGRPGVRPPGQVLSTPSLELARATPGARPSSPRGRGTRPRPAYRDLTGLARTEPPGWRAPQEWRRPARGTPAACTCPSHAAR